MKTQTFLLVALLATGFLPLANAGSQDAPEITDASEDQALSGGSPLQAVLDLLPGGDAFEDIDILKAWVNETDDTTFTINVESAGPVATDTSTTITYSVDPGEASEFGSTADGTVVTIQLTGDSIDSGADNATVASSGNVQTITLTRADAGVSGGDVFRNFTVDRSRSSDDLAPVVAPGQTADDSAGPGTDYTFSRIPVVGAGTLAISGGEIGGEAFTGAEATAHDDASGFFTAHVTNTGTDVDEFELQATVLNGTATVEVQPQSAVLNPGADTQFTITFNATESEESVVIDVHLTSENGADTMKLGTVSVGHDDHGDGGDGHDDGGDGHDDGDGHDEREDATGVLGFLTSTAEATSFDDIFGDYAELVLLLLLLLLLILLILLLLLLLRKGWLAGAVDPKTITAGPGDEVEFGISVRNRRKDFHTVETSFASDGEAAGLVMKPEDGVAMEAITEEGVTGSFDLTRKGELGDRAEGTLLVRAPELEGKHHVDVWFTPLDEDGEPRTKKGTKVRATVKVVDQAEAADAPALSMGEVVHTPAQPVEGEDVVTSTTVTNNGDEDAELRVVLLVDNDPVQQETIRVAADSTAAVEFPWTAARGKNKVRVQVFEA